MAASSEDQVQNPHIKDQNFFNVHFKVVSEIWIAQATKLKTQQNGS